MRIFIVGERMMSNECGRVTARQDEAERNSPMEVEGGRDLASHGRSPVLDPAHTRTHTRYVRRG